MLGARSSWGGRSHCGAGLFFGKAPPNVQPRRDAFRIRPMLPRSRGSYPPSFGGFGSSPAAPRALLLLIGFMFLTFVFQFFASTRELLQPLRLNELVWRGGQVWRLATYGFVGFGQPSLWFILQLAVLFWFGRDVLRALGRRTFWQLLGAGVVVAGAVAVGVDASLSAQGFFPERLPFIILQGQQILLAILVAAFAVLYANATILLMFVLPVPARWFLPLEILMAFLAFLWSKDLGGFLGLSAAVLLTWWWISGNGPRRALRELRLRLERRILAARLSWNRRRRGLKVIQGGKSDDNVRRGPWVN